MTLKSAYETLLDEVARADGVVRNVEVQTISEILTQLSDQLDGYAEATDASSGVVDMRSSYRLKEGLRPDGPGWLYDGAFLIDFEYVEGLGDLDECNGRVGVTPEHPEGIYHYYITEMFQFIPRCVKGTPDESFQRRGGRHGAPGSGPPPGRRGNGRLPGEPGNSPPGPPRNRPPRLSDEGIYPPPL